MGQILKPGNPQSYFFDPNSVIANGDMVMWNTSSNAVQRLTAATDYASFIGVAEFQTPPSSPLDTSQVVLGGAGVTDMGLVRRAGIFPMLTTPSETYKHGDAVKWAANGQIALDSGANQIIGYINMPGGGTLVGAASVSVEIELYSRFGSPVLLSA